MITILRKQLFDPSAIMYVLGCLIKKPSLLAEVDKVKLDKEDFDDKLTKFIFLAIYNLYLNGANKISAVDIEAYLNQHAEAYKLFKESNGFSYISDAEEIADVDNFIYYYNRIKKFSALRELHNSGYSIKEVYDPDINLPDKQRKMLEHFDRMSIKEVFDVILKKYTQLETKYVGALSGSRGTIFDGMKDLQSQLKRAPEVGFPLQGKYLNTILRGARRTKFYIRSGASGSGKSRGAMGDACGLAFPIRYDKKLRKWINTGFSEKVLFVTTEMAIDELQTLVWAYLADVNEEKILFHNYEEDEEERVEKAIEIAEKYKDNFFWEHIPDPTIETVTAAIRNQVRTHEITHVFYDYIFSGPSMLRDFSGQNIREDVILAMFSTKLKELGNELDIFMASSTQLNGKWEDEAKTGIRNQNMIRGSKAIIDKCDAGYITLPVTQEEQRALENLVRQKGYKKPTHVTDVYKIRRGRYKDTRVWSFFDLGTCRIEDLFVTDAMFNEISVPVLSYKYTDWDDCDV